MHRSRLVPRSAIGWLRGLSLAVLLLSAAWLPAAAAEADLALVVTAAPVPVVVDQALRFSLDLVNQGPDSAEDVTVEINLPAEVSLAAATPTQGVCLPGSTLICQLGQVSADAPGNRAGVTVDMVTDVVADISLAATVVSSTADLFLDNNAATASLSIVAFRASADLIVAPQILPTATFSGLPSELVIEVANTGPAPAGSVAVKVGVQELRMASYLSASSSQGPCSSALDTCADLQCQEVLDQLLEVSCALGSMAADSTAWVRVTSNIDLPAQTHLTVSVDVGARDTADSDGSNNFIEVDVPVVEMPGDGVQAPNTPLIGGGSIGPGCFIQALLL
ncbi:MAG: hypothetical protein P1P84_00010 [Deferrisomatales bacterium]|nr:hypothetical protein [Deferrisomatales bacterium]